MKARLSSKSIGLYCKTHWIGTKRTYPSRLTYLMRQYTHLLWQMVTTTLGTAKIDSASLRLFDETLVF